MFVSRDTMIGAIAGATALVGMASSAMAGDFLLTATRVNDILGTSNSFVDVPLDDAGHLSLTFKTTAPNMVVVLRYNAECGYSSAGVGNWASVQILVDGVVADPLSANGFALCTATVANTFTWTAALRQSVYKVPLKGTHKVEVQAMGTDSTPGTWWLGEPSFTVEN